MESHHQGRPSRAPVNLGSTVGQPTVNLGSTLGQRSVISLPISGRFSRILLEFRVKQKDYMACWYEMIDFPIGKQHFRGSSLIGAPWEPPGRKKRGSQMFLQDLRIFASRRSQNFSKKSPEILARMNWSSFHSSRKSMNFVIFLLNVDEILSEFREELT